VEAGGASAENLVVGECVKLLGLAVGAEPSALQAMYDSPDAKQSIVDSLLATQERSVRVQVKQTLSRMIVKLCDPTSLPDGVGRPNDYFAEVLADSLDDVYANPEGCLEYFRLFVDCLRIDTEKAPMKPKATSDESKDESGGAVVKGSAVKQTPPPPPPSPSALDVAVALQPKDGVPDLRFDASTFAGMLVARIKSHPIVEVSAEDFDLVLRGLLRTLHALLLRVPSLAPRLGSSEEEGGLGIVDFVYESGLFHQEEHEKPGADPSTAPDPADEQTVKLPLCKSRHTRKAAMDLLSAIAQRYEPSAAKLCSLVSAHHSPEASSLSKSSGVTSKPRAYDRFGDMAKSSTGYVGLVN